MAQEIPAWLGKALAGKNDEFLPNWLTVSLDKRSKEVAGETPLTKKTRSLGAGENDLDSEVPFQATDDFPRGIRNNNPGNIEIGDPWQGMATDEELTPRQQDETRFVVFKSPEFGVRAIGRLMQTYRTKHGLSTVRGIISRWAPPEENDTESYIKTVADFMGVGADDKIDTTSPTVLGPLVSAIIRHENGQQPYPETVIMAGINLALGRGE
jgi:hypothetical protein